MVSALQSLLDVFAVRSPTRTEADVQTHIAAFLTAVPLGLTTSQINAHAEDQLGDGTQRRIDISYGKLIIEVKRDFTTTGTLNKAIPQLEGYLKTRREHDGFEYAGIITDGVEWVLYDRGPHGMQELSRHTVQPAADSQAVEHLRLWLETILLTGTQVPVSPKVVAERLGTTSPRFRLDRSRLEALYFANENNPELALKRQLWARLLRTALGTSFEDDPALFIDHTLLVIEAEIIAHLVVGLNPGSYSASELVSGTRFSEAGIFNVVEADFFDWPAQVEGGDEFVLSLVRELSQFDWSTVQHDVLKILYESVISPEVRKNLGEYYTPDWLAYRVIEARVTDPLTQRVMDPSCGSGTFVFHCVRKVLAAADEAGMDNADALDLVQARVFGMDIHPVSVVLARVTYLLAIGRDRLTERRALNIPVYLGDSVQWTRSASSFADGTVKVPVDAPDLASAEGLGDNNPGLFSVGEYLAFPLTSVTDPATFDALVSALSTKAHSYTVPGAKFPSIVALLAQYNVDVAKDQDTLTDTFHTLCKLNAEGRDHIWSFFVRNQIRPLWFSLPDRRMDVLVGNPPWVAYRYMTASMQKQFKALSEQRGLWAGGKVATQQDLVGLFIARAVEQFLQPDGVFGFVTPLAVLSRMQYAGFREGSWARGVIDGLSKQELTVRVEFERSWDLSKVRPAIFPVPAAVVFGGRADAAVPLPPETTVISGKSEALVEAVGSISALTADDVAISPYAKRVVNGVTIFPRMIFVVEKAPASPLGQVAGVSNVTSLRSSQEKQPWKGLPSIGGAAEDVLIHEMLMGSSIAPYRVLQPSLAILPVVGGVVLKKREMQNYPKFYERWSAMDAVWETHKQASSKLSLIQQLDFQSKLTRQVPGTPHRVVYAKAGNRTAAARITDPDVIIDHKLYWMSTDSADEARFLVAILNSAFVAAEVASRQSQGLFGGRDIDMLPWRLDIPLYDAANASHLGLARLGERAETEAAAVELAPETPFVEARKLVRGALYGVLNEIEVAVTSLLASNATQL